MNSHPRIMLLEPNRCRALLMQRRIEQRDSAAIVVRFSDLDQALAELGRNGYTAAFVNIDSAPALWPAFLQSALQRSPELNIVALTSDLVSAAEFDKLARCPQCHLVHVNETDEFLASLPGLLKSSPKDFDRQPVKYRPSRLSGLIVAGQ